MLRRQLEKEREREREREKELGNYEGQFMMRYDLSQTCRFTSSSLRSAEQGECDCLRPRMFARDYRLKGMTGRETRKKTAGQFDGTEATADISPTRRHRGNLALRRTEREVTAIPAKFVVFLGALSTAWWDTRDCLRGKTFPWFQVGDFNAFRLFMDSQNA